MKYSMKICACLTALVFAQAAHAGATKITFADTAHIAGEEWPMMSGFWYVRALLVDSSLQPIGNLSEETTFNTASAPSLPTGTLVLLDAPAAADVSIVVYRSNAPITDGSTVEQAIYSNVCGPTGCPAGNVTIPSSGPTAGQLRNTDFHPNAKALPVKLQEFSVE